MKVYRIKADVRNYQWIMPNISEDQMFDYLVFDCEKKSEDWNKVGWYVDNPKQKKGNFYNINSGVLVFDEKVFDSELFTVFEMTGQILSINVEGEKLYILNILSCINSLDQNNSTFDYYDDGTRGRILEYAFHDRLSESSIFKIPETYRGEMLTYSGVKDKEEEFFSLYKDLKFTGLIFEQLYSR